MKKYSLMVNIDGKEHEVTLTEAQLIKAYEVEQYNLDRMSVIEAIENAVEDGWLSEKDAERLKAPTMLETVVKAFSDEIERDSFIQETIDNTAELVVREAAKAKIDAEV